MAAENESGFEIDGAFYEIPTIDSFNMDEAQVMYDYSRLTIEDFGTNPNADEDESEERAERFRNPGVIRALMHIAYQRGNPKTKPAKVKELIGSANMIDTYMVLADNDTEEEQSPLASTTEPPQSSPSGSVESSTSSGSDSTIASDPQGSPPGTTGTGRSDTSSQESPPKLSVA